MDISSPTGTVIFDRDDHPSRDRITFVERENGEIAVLLNDRESQIWDRLKLLSKYIKHLGNTNLESEYSKAIDIFFHEYFTEAEWTLAALANT